MGAYDTGLRLHFASRVLRQLIVRKCCNSQAGPVVNVHMPKDKVTQMHQGYGFVEFRSEIDADYAMKLMNMVQTTSLMLHQ